MIVETSSTIVGVGEMYRGVWKRKMNGESGGLLVARLFVGNWCC